MRNEIPASQIYSESLLSAEAPSKLKSREFAMALGLEQISLSPSEGALLRFLVQLHGCKKFVEIGTLTGLSAQYLIEGLGPQGQLWSLEKNEIHSERALQAWSTHPLGKNIHAVVGDARATLSSLEAKGPFDGIFIDGNKGAYGDYLIWAEAHLRPGGLLIADNVFLAGAVWNSANGQKFSEKQVRVLQEFNRRLADPQLYQSVIVPTQEGLYVALKKF
jgi:predicted O-methyltransferase YrrM